MKKILILIVEDEPEVRAALLRDLRPFAPHFRIEAAEDVPDAEALLDECPEELGLILCDHRLPGESGVSFLTRLARMENRAAARKVLVTGQADQQDTIRAINEGGLHHYIAKPWTETELLDVVRDQLTRYILAREINPLPYLPILDAPRLLEKISKQGWTE